MDGDARPSLAKGHTMGERRPSSAAAERDDDGAGTFCAMTAPSVALLTRADPSLFACRYSCCRCWKMKTHDLEPCFGYVQSQLELVLHPAAKQQNEECVDIGNFKVRNHGALLHSYFRQKSNFIPNRLHATRHQACFALLLRATCDSFFL